MNFLTNKLSKVTKHSKGKMPRNLGSKNSTRSIPYIDIKAFESGEIRRYCDDSNVNICLPTDTLIVWDGARFGLSGIGKSGAVGSTIMKLTPSDLIDHKYYNYFVKSKYFEINSKPRGVGIPHVEPSFFWNLEISYPEKKMDQQKIVDKIEELFSVTDNNTASLKATRRTLINLRRKILDHAFKGELTKDIHDLGFEYDTALQELEASRKKLFSSYKGGRYKQVSGEVKKNARWLTIPLEAFGLIETGATPLRGNTEYWKNGTIPWVTSTVVNQQKVTEASELITNKALKETNTKLFPVSTLLIAMYGEGKTRGKVSELMIEAATNQALAGVILSEEAEQYKDFIKLFLYKNYEDLRRLASGGVQPNLNLMMIKEMQIPFPSKKEQSAIIDILTRYLSIIDNAIAQIDQILVMAGNLRQSILKQAFEGKLV